MAVTRAFGEFLSAARGAQGLSQEQLAELADIDRTTVSKLELGKGNPTLLTMNKLAVVLNESFAGLLPCRPQRGRN